MTKSRLAALMAASAFLVLASVPLASAANADVVFLYGFDNASMTLSDFPGTASFTGTFAYDATTSEVSDVNFTVTGASLPLSPDYYYQSGGAAILQVNTLYNLSAIDNSGAYSINLDFENSLGGGAYDKLELNNDDSQSPYLDGHYAIKVSGGVDLISSVPEPATWAMFLIGFGGIGFLMRIRRKSAAATA
jgi:hypothetical protein